MAMLIRLLAFRPLEVSAIQSLTFNRMLLPVLTAGTSLCAMALATNASTAARAWVAADYGHFSSGLRNRLGSRLALCKQIASFCLPHLECGPIINGGLLFCLG